MSSSLLDAIARPRRLLLSLLVVIHISCTSQTCRGRSRRDGAIVDAKSRAPNPDARINMHNSAKKGLSDVKELEYFRGSRRPLSDAHLADSIMRRDVD